MPEYLFCYFPYSKTINSISKVTGETSCYYKIGRDSNIRYIRKSNLKLKGSDLQYYSMSKQEFIEYTLKEKMKERIRRVNVDNLSMQQLEKICEIIGVKI